MKKFLLLFIIIIFARCSPIQEKQGDVFTIPLDYDFANVLPFEKSDLEVNYEFIPIITDTSNLEAFVDEVTNIKFYKDHFYFVTYMGRHGGNFKIFDKNGKFIKSSVNGNGPGELGAFLSDFYFDKENDLIQVVSLNKIICYDLEGNYVRTIPIDVTYSNVFKFGDYRFSNSTGTLDSGYIKIVNNNTQRVVSFVVNKTPKESKQNTLTLGDGKTTIVNVVNNYCSYTTNNSNLYFNLTGDNYIYKINKGDSIPYKFALIENIPNFDKKESGEQDYEKNRFFKSIFTLAVFDDNLFAFSLEGESKKDVTRRVIYDHISGKTYRHPTPSAVLIYSDGECEYFHVGSSILKHLKKRNIATERAIIEGIEKIREDMETCIVKVAISRKNN